VAIFGGVQFLGLAQACRRDGDAAFVDDSDPDAAWDGVYRIDPRTNRVTSFIRLQPTPVGLTVAYGRVWVTEAKPRPGIVVRIDPRNNRVSSPPIRVGVGPGGIVSGAGTLWVANMNYVSRINPATGAVANAGGGPWGGTDRLGNAKISRIDAAGAGSLWTTGANVVQRLDPANGHVTAAIPGCTRRVIFWHGLAWALTGVAPSGWEPLSASTRHRTASSSMGYFSAALPWRSRQARLACG
jgi:DNA-binding beta-propeller fold protein YncE